MIDFQLGASDARSLYRLAKEIISDIRKNFSSERHLRLARYKTLFECIRMSHAKYMDLFERFIKSTTYYKGDSSKAKNEFMKGRNAYVSRSLIDKSDALTYIELTNDRAERRFLFSVAWYYHYIGVEDYRPYDKFQMDEQIEFMQSNLGGSGGAWDSASARFWDDIEDNQDIFQCRKQSYNMVDSLNSRFASVVVNYTALELRWKFNVKGKIGGGFTV